MADHFRWVKFWKSSEKTFSYLNFFVFSWTAFFYFLLASHISKIKSNTHTGCWRQRVAGVHTLSIPTVVIHFHLKHKFLKRLAPLFIGIYALLCCREWIADSRARTRHIKSGRSLRKKIKMNQIVEMNLKNKNRRDKILRWHANFWIKVRQTFTYLQEYRRVHYIKIYALGPISFSLLSYTYYSGGSSYG